MNERSARLWIKELRSGNHNQGWRALENSVGQLCCLGVACRAAEADGVPIDITTDGASTVLPLSVQKWLGTSSDPTLGLDSATRRNDVLRQNFRLIADAIEWQLERRRV